MSGAMLTFFMYYYVTEARKAYQLLAEQQIISINSSKLAALGEMAGGIAHEINNPLAIISGYMQQLRKILSDFPHMAEKTEKQLSKIESMVTRISRIVLGLRSFARDGSADPVERFSLQSLVEESLILAETKLKTMGVSLKQIMPSEVIWLDGQKVQLSQVLVNLINNAFDAIEPNQEKWISIQAQIIGQRLELSVTDSGHGIPLKVQEKLMQPFYTTKPLGKGTGLGLSISKGIVERHKGRFYYDSKCQNTRFVLDLPIAATSRSSVAA
jgi:C4-dicarboxylate-specific signal transduction histidine kinase